MLIILEGELEEEITHNYVQLHVLARTESCGVHLQIFYQLILLLLVAHNISLPTSAQKQQKRKKENKLQQ